MSCKLSFKRMHKQATRMVMRILMGRIGLMLRLILTDTQSPKNSETTTRQSIFLSLIEVSSCEQLFKFKSAFHIEKKVVDKTYLKICVKQTNLFKKKSIKKLEGIMCVRGAFAYHMHLLWCSYKQDIYLVKRLTYGNNQLTLL